MYAITRTRTDIFSARTTRKADRRGSRAGQVENRTSAFDLSRKPLRTDILNKQNLESSRYGWKSLPLSEIRRLKDEVLQFARKNGINVSENRYDLSGIINAIESATNAELRLIEDDLGNLCLYTRKVHEDGILFWLQIKPTFENMGEEMGRLVRGIFTLLVKKHGFMDLTDWFNAGYGEYIMEGVEDDGYQEDEREYIEYIESSRSGLIAERMKEAMTTDITMEDILEYSPTADEQELHHLLIEGMKWFEPNQKFNLIDYLMNSEDMEQDFTIESSLRFALTYDIDDRITEDMFNSIDEDINQDGYMNPVSEMRPLNSMTNHSEDNIKDFLDWLHRLIRNIS